MSVIVQFERREDQVRAVGVLTEAEETYHGVDKGTILVSGVGIRMLRAQGIRFRVVGGEERREEEPNDTGS